LTKRPQLRWRDRKCYLLLFGRSFSFCSHHPVLDSRQLPVPLYGAPQCFDSLAPSPEPWEWRNLAGKQNQLVTFYKSYL
jgi:hypothetical protein